MQSVSASLASILESNSRDLIPVVEFYHFDAVPSVSGFDPAQADFIAGYAAVNGVLFRSRTYQRKVNSFGDVKRTITKEFNNFSVTLNNQDRVIAGLHLTIGFEGLILVVRLISQSASTTLSDSIVLFVGRCEKPDAFDRLSESVSISAKQIIGSTELQMPRRRFAPDDEEGRHPSDPFFEGFRFSVQYGNVQYSVRERRGGLLGLLGFKKSVLKTLQYSSHSSLDAEKAVPEVFGRAQISGHHVGYVDVGTSIQALTAFCEGKIWSYQSVRSVTPGFSIGALAELVGDTGAQGIDPNWVAPGHYSRTAHIRSAVLGTQAQVDDPAPEIVALILGRLIDLPDSSGIYNQIGWSDNPVHIARFILTSPDFLKLTANFVDDGINADAAKYADEILLDQSGTDAVYLPPSEVGRGGTDYQMLRPTGSCTPEFFLTKTGALLTDAEQKAPYLKQVQYNYFSDSLIPIEPSDPPNPGGGGDEGGNLSLATFILRRRYTANVVVTESQKIVDFLFNVLFPAARMYLVTTAKGRIGIKIAKPVDNSLLRSDSSAGATAIAVYDVEPWKLSLNGFLLIGANKLNSEGRRVTSANYTTASNAITLQATNASTSGATLTGANNTNLTATGSIVINNLAAENTISIGGYSINYTPASNDTLVTVAGFFWAAINGHPVLQKFIRAEWSATSTVAIKSKLGSLVLDQPLTNAHTAGIVNPVVAASATAAGGGSLPPGSFKLSYSFQTANGETLPSPQTIITVTANQKLNVGAVTLPSGATAINWYLSVAGATTMRLRRVAQNTGAAFSIPATPSRNKPIEPNYNSTSEEVIRYSWSFDSRNTIKGTFKFPLGARQPSTNRIDLKFNDAVQDFKTTELRVKDAEHVARVKKVLAKEISGAAIDNYHQAKRIANGNLAEAREGDFFTALSADGVALLLEEGEVILISDDSGGIVNLPVRIEDVTIKLSSGNPQILISAKRYSKSFYSDDADERVLPLPSTLAYPRAGSSQSIERPSASSTITQPFTLFGLAANATATLPDATNVLGRRYIIKNTGSGVLTVACVLGQTIDSASTKTLNQFDRLEVVSDGNEWLII